MTPIRKWEGGVSANQRKDAGGRERGPAQTTEGKNEARKEDEEDVGGTETGAIMLDKNNAMRREKES